MSFKKSTTQESEVDDSKYYCSVSGCGARWSINLGIPKCSYHQWNRDTHSGYENIYMKLENPINDGRDWARLILQKYQMGYKVRPISLKFAKEALRISVET